MTHWQLATWCFTTFGVAIFPATLLAGDERSMTDSVLAAAARGDHMSAVNALQAVGDSAEGFSAEEGARLLNAALTADLSPDTTIMAIRIVADHPDSELHRQMIRELASRVPLRRSANNEAGNHSLPPIELRRLSTLQSEILSHLQQAEWCPNPGALPEFWVVLANVLAFETGCIGAEPPSAQAERLLLRVNGFEDEKENAVLQMIDLQHHQATWDASPLLTALRPTCWPSLRQRLRQSVDDGGPLRLNVAAVLAQLGDAEALPLFDELRTRLQGRQGWVDPTFDPFRPHIERQNPPENLLRIIENVDPKTMFDHGGLAEWAIRRAVQRGLHREAIKNAILIRAEKISAAAVASSERYAARLGQSAMRSLKRVGIDQGILTDADLPDVKARKP